MKINADIKEVFASDFSCKLVTFVNPFSYYLLEGREKSFTHVFSDGILLVCLYNFFSNKKIKRNSFDFTSAAPIVFDYCTANRLKVSLIGGTEEEIRKAKKVIIGRFPAIDIVYSHHGFIKGKEQKILDELRDNRTQVLISGMGTPLQEDFLVMGKNTNSNLLYGFTCGGFLSQISQREDYFNPLLSKLHLRWLQRFVRHSYVRKRILIDYPRFIVKYLSEKVKS